MESRDFVIGNYQPYIPQIGQKESFKKGTFSVLFRRWDSIIIPNFSYFEKPSGQKWIYFPSYPSYASGVKKYEPFGTFYEPNKLADYSKNILTALEDYFKKNPQYQNALVPNAGMEVADQNPF